MAELPRGIRNNNPGNLRPLRGDRWRGEIPPDTGRTPDPNDEMGSYSRFSSPEFGIRALIRDCRKKRRRGLDTIVDATSAAGWEFSSAIAINNAGQIVGTGLHNSAMRAFLLTPVSTDAAASTTAGSALVR